MTVSSGMIQSIEEGPAGFSTVQGTLSEVVPVYRGGAGRVLNIGAIRPTGHTSLSRRGRQGSQPLRQGEVRHAQSIEEGPAGFSTWSRLISRALPVYRGGAGRVLNVATHSPGSAPSLSRRGRQGSQRHRAAPGPRLQSIEEGPAGFSTFSTACASRCPVYRGGAGRVLNGSITTGIFCPSLSRRGRQGSQLTGCWASSTTQSIEEGPAGFSTGFMRLARSPASLSRRGRQGSQLLNCESDRLDQSIEEGPAGFSTPCWCGRR